MPPPTPTTCPDENALAEFADGLLEPEEAARVEHHMRDCANCRQVVAALAEGLSKTSPPSDRNAGSSGLPGVESTWLPRGALLGRYVILRPLGAGGMGIVYLANDPELARKVAIKLMRADVVGSRLSEAATRLRREAQAMARLSHPNVITVFDVGTFGEQVFVAMEYVNGGSLGHWLHEATRPPREVLEKFLLAGRGLAAAHAAGLIHRDFKPDNVLLGRDGRVRVTDFGLARATGPRPLTASTHDSLAKSGPGLLEASLTMSGAVVGTPAYMAPEQLAGQPSDARTDQYSFCVALYEGLYGERPLPGATLESISAIAKRALGTREPEHRNQLPPWLNQVLAKGMSSSPADRYPAMEGLLAALDNPPKAERRWVWPAAALAATAVAGGALWSWLPVGQPLSNPRVAVREQTAPGPQSAGTPERAESAVPAPAPADPILERPAIAPSAAAPSPKKDPAKAPKSVAAKADPRPAPAPVAPPQLQPPAPAPQASAAPARLSVHVSPWADIEVDGKVVARGKMDFALELPSGPHQLALKNPYFQPYLEAVELASGQTLEKRVKLVRLDSTP